MCGGGHIDRIWPQDILIEFFKAQFIKFDELYLKLRELYFQFGQYLPKTMNYTSKNSINRCFPSIIL